MSKPNMKIRRSDERGRNRFAWLDSAHSFSFGDYYDPKHMGFRSLRVINEDWIKGGGGFPPHPHQDMEILTYPIRGSLQHRDSTGSEGVIGPGDIQLMGAGHGIVHSEFNASPTEEVHLLQIWMYPSRKGLAPTYQQHSVRDAVETKAWTRLLQSESSNVSIAEALKETTAKVLQDESLTPRQDLELWAKRSSAGEVLDWQTATPQAYWLQLIKGELLLDGQSLHAGDAVSLEDVMRVNLVSKTESEFILFVF